MTNRHVASEFAALSLTPGGRAFVFKRGWPERSTRMAARVDFRRELRNNSPRAFVVGEVVHIVDLATGMVLGLHFSGVFLRENRGVPIRYVADRLQKVLNPPRRTEAADRPPAPVPDSQPGPTPVPAQQAPSEGRAVSWTIPLSITVSVGVPTAGASPGLVAAPPTGGAAMPQPAPAPPATIDRAVGEAGARLQGRSDVVDVRDGYQFRNGWITPDPAVVVVLRDRPVATGSRRTSRTTGWRWARPRGTCSWDTTGSGTW